MRIAITNPTNWPYLRRGAERFINELAYFLAGRGHDVTVITGKPGKGKVVVGSGYKTIYHRRLWHPVLARIGFLEFHAFFLPTFFSLLRRRYDAVVCMTFMDGYAAKLTRTFTDTPYVYVPTGPPPRIMYFRSLTLKGAIWKRVTLGADAAVVSSLYTMNYFQQRWGGDYVHIPAGVDMNQFQPIAAADRSRPIILSAAALDDPRKGGRVLMRAFNVVKLQYPDALLQVAYPMHPDKQAELLQLVEPQWQPDVQFVSGEDNLPELLARASVSVLPSLWDSQGKILIESMAAGTPVAATRDGALPEFVTSPHVGRLFDPGPDTVLEPTNFEGLASAISECLQLSLLSETSSRCREYAGQYSWERMGGRMEALLRQLVAARTGIAECAEPGS